ncbi:hypothetical protein AB0J72_02450 [Dactylosporangium sp. NPDC049742]|uniref:hypothetical protein n=1 Tax=Dactylosporangium sp. NPDC049742 TaxID=3154737 RepID=UPI0034495AB7
MRTLSWRRREWRSPGTGRSSWSGTGHDAEYGLGPAPQRVLGRAPSLRIGVYTVDEHVLPYLLFVSLYDDSAGTYATLAENLAVFDRATGRCTAPGW